MIHPIVSAEDGDFQSSRDSRPFPNPAAEGLRSDSEETLLSLRTVMSRDIRTSLLSMLATLKLLNRGYYGNMDEGVAHQTKNLLSSTTRLLGRVDACLGRAFAGEEKTEIVAPQKAGIE